MIGPGCGSLSFFDPPRNRKPEAGRGFRPPRFCRADAGQFALQYPSQLRILGKCSKVVQSRVVRWQHAIMQNGWPVALRDCASLVAPAFPRHPECRHLQAACVALQLGQKKLVCLRGFTVGDKARYLASEATNAKLAHAGSF